MTFAELKNKILAAAGKIKEKTAAIWSLPHAKKYIFLSIVLTLFLVVVFFPYDVIIRKQIKRIEPSISRGIYIGDFNFSMFGNSRIDELDIILHNQSGITIRNLLFNFRYNPVTLLINKNLTGTFSIQNFLYEKDETSLSAVVKSVLDMKINDGTGRPVSGSVETTLSNVQIKGLSVKGFNIAPIKFTVIETAATIKGDEITIGRISFSGNDLAGTVSGSIRLSSLIANSVLNITVEIDSRSKMLENYKLMLGFLPKPSGNKIIIPVTGTVGNPRIQLQPAPIPEPRLR